MKKYLVPLAAILFLGLVTPSDGQDDCPPVTDLKRLIAEDADFRAVALEMFEGLQPMPDGSPNPWRGKSLDDLYAFLNDWYRFLPNRHDGLDRIMEFSLLYRNNPAGLRFVLQSLKHIEVDAVEQCRPIFQIRRPLQLSLNPAA